MTTMRTTPARPLTLPVMLLLLLAVGHSSGQSLGGGVLQQLVQNTSPAPRLAALTGGDCGNRDIAQCVEMLEVLTSKDIGFAASREELTRMCPVLLSGLQCIDNYTLRCLSPQHRSYFNKLYNGTMLVIRDLCTSRGGRYQEEYIRHAPCMRQVNPKYNRCSEVYHSKTAGLNQAVVRLSERDKARNVITLCCSFQEYLQCSERVVYESCGNDTALFTKNFLNRMAGPIVQDICTLVNFVPGDCRTINHPHTKPRSPFFAQSIYEPLSNTLNRPTIQSPANWRPQDRGTLQHYNTFDRAQPNTPTRMHPSRVRPRLQFVGIRNGTRIYRRPRPNFENDRRQISLSRTLPPRRNRPPDGRVTYLRRRDGKKRIQLRRGSRLRNTGDTTETSVNDRSFRGIKPSSPLGLPRRRHFRRQASPKFRQMPFIVLGYNETLPREINKKSIQIHDGFKPVNRNTINYVNGKVGPRSRGKWRHLRRRKRLQRIIANRRKYQQTTMIQTLLDKLVRDAHRYSYEVSTYSGSKESVEDPIHIVHHNTINHKNHDLEYDHRSFQESEIMNNASLSDPEKFIALLRFKMLSNLEETIITVDNAAQETYFGDNMYINEPLLVDMEETAFMYPHNFNLSLYLPDDLNVSDSELEQVWFTYDDIRDTNIKESNEEKTESSVTAIKDSFENNNLDSIDNYTSSNILTETVETVNDFYFDNKTNNASWFMEPQVSENVEKNNSYATNYSESLIDKNDSNEFPDIVNFLPENITSEDHEKNNNYNLNGKENNMIHTSLENETNVLNNFKNFDKILVENSGDVNSILHQNEIPFDYEDYFNSTFDINIEEELLKLKMKPQNTLSKGNVKNLPLPLVTLIFGIHMIM